MKAEFLAIALGGQRCGQGWIAPCPAHDDRVPSLSIRDAENGNVLIHCHAGCEQALVIDALRSLGLWEGASRGFTQLPTQRFAATDRQNRDAAKRTEVALVVWRSAKVADGTLVETYLLSRGLNPPAPPTLRFHAGLKHPSGGVWPAMVALVTRADGTPIAVNRTFLAHDGNGKAPVEPAKMMLGPCRGGAVQLGEPCGVVMVGEGIETCFAVVQATGLPAWAALSTSGLRDFDLPGDARNVIVLADGDEPGEAAAQDSARRWKREGRRVRIARPGQGLDFNDMLMRRTPGILEGAR